MTSTNDFDTLILKNSKGRTLTFKIIAVEDMQPKQTTRRVPMKPKNFNKKIEEEEVRTFEDEEEVREFEEDEEEVREFEEDEEEVREFIE